MTFVRGVLAVAGAAALIWAVVVALAWGFQRHLVYLPDRSTPDPAVAGVPVEEVTLRTDDGLDLGAWFVPARGEAVTTVLVASGNAGNRTHRVPLATALAERGHHTLLMDYRGYGGNPGRPHEQGLTRDIRAAHAHLRARDDVDAERIVLFGESLGSGVVAALAAEREPAAVVLRSPFPSLADVGRRHYPFLPVRTLLRERFPVSERLEHYGGPVLVVAGERDRVVPTELSRSVAAAVGAQYVEISGADHNDAALLSGPEMHEAVDAFLRSAAGR